MIVVSYTIFTTHLIKNNDEREEKKRKKKNYKNELREQV